MSFDPTSVTASLASPVPGELLNECRDLVDTAGLSISAEALAEWLLGIGAAPRPDPSVWVRMIAPGADPRTAERLVELKDRLVAAKHPSLALADRLDAVRAALADQGLDGMFVGHADEQQSEYLPADAERLAWLTGFTGSAGMAVVLKEVAALFVDGRYTIQARAQVDAVRWRFLHLVDDPQAEWVAKTAPKGSRIGFDPRLFTAEWAERTRAALEGAEIALVAMADNPIDRLWKDRPSKPLAPILPHDVAYAGRGAAEKIDEIAASIKEQRADAALLVSPESIAWLLNLRGGDVPHTPMPISYGVVHAEGRVELYVDGRKLTHEARTRLGNRVTVEEVDRLPDGLVTLGRAKKSVLVDVAVCNAWLTEKLTGAGARLVKGKDPVALPRARKNAVEIEGARNAHRRDARPILRFLAWFDREAPKGGLTELDTVKALHDFRAEHPLFRDDSFETIAGAGPNSALPHYHVSPQSNRPVVPGEIFLIDSGAQYDDGTTDITRTVIVGEPTAEMRLRFTQVLKGHIRLSSVRFPKGTTGSQLDVLAREALWADGCDYDHGTGHGVGSYLSVHEGPHRISKVPNTVALDPGMIVSNEPGYYREGHFGIRIENLIAVRPPKPVPGGDREMLSFETLTFAPIDLRLVEPSLMTPEEIAWLDAYHAMVQEVAGSDLSAEEHAFLERSTRPIGR